MTLQQLKYVITVAETGTITEAANKLYISQPSLTNAVHELEKEMNIVIFNRTNKGISLSKEGEDFLGYARQVLEQAAILEDKYKKHDGGKKQFCVSTQHYSFAVNAFVDLIKQYGQEEYDFSLRETQTYEIIEDVAKMRSEIGILFLNDFNEAVIGKILKSHDLQFHLLFVAKPHVFISRKHPLAANSVIINKELQSAAEQELSEQDMTEKSLIDELQLDSVALMELAAEIEERFGIHLDEAPSLLELFDNYDKLLEYLQQNAADHNVSGKENV